MDSIERQFEQERRRIAETSAASDANDRRRMAREDAVLNSRLAAVSHMAHAET
jgi:hypothetical protein